MQGDLQMLSIYFFNINNCSFKKKMFRILGMSFLKNSPSSKQELKEDLKCLIGYKLIKLKIIEKPTQLNPIWSF